MSEEQRSVRARRPAGFLKRVFFTLGAFMLFIFSAVRKDLVRILQQARLFLGIAFATIGMLSFASDRYCDGAIRSYQSCTRPATYYYYPKWAILAVVLGVFLTTLWFLRSKRS